jgi:hypothetical protein
VYQIDILGSAEQIEVFVERLGRFAEQPGDAYVMDLGKPGADECGSLVDGAPELLCLVDEDVHVVRDRRTDLRGEDRGCDGPDLAVELGQGLGRLDLATQRAALQAAVSLNLAEDRDQLFLKGSRIQGSLLDLAA